MDYYFDYHKVAPLLNQVGSFKCNSCGKPFLFAKSYAPISEYFDQTDRVQGYEHAGGWLIDGVKYWLYVTCKSCSYQTSFEKLGIKRVTFKIFKDVDDDGEFFTVYKGKRCMGAYLSDDVFVRGLIKAGYPVLDGIDNRGMEE